MSVPTRDEMLQALELKQGKALQEKLSAAAVAVCGLGGLGSNIAVSLARAGIGRLILIDFDRVDVTNLHRQQYAAAQVGDLKAEALAKNLLAIAPYGRYEPHAVRITEDNLEELLGEADVVCEAFDRADQKAMLVNGVLERLPDKFLVAASGMAGLDSGNAIRTRRIAKRFYLCGDEVSDVDSAHCLVAPRVTLCAAHQALTILRILAEKFEP